MLTRLQAPCRYQAILLHPLWLPHHDCSINRTYLSPAKPRHPNLAHGVLRGVKRLPILEVSASCS